MYNLTTAQSNLASFRITDAMATTSTEDARNKKYMKDLEQHFINSVKNKSDKHCVIELERDLLSDMERETMEMEAMEFLAEERANESGILFSDTDIQNQMDEMLYKKSKEI